MVGIRYGVRVGLQLHPIVSSSTGCSDEVPTQAEAESPPVGEKQPPGAQDAPLPGLQLSNGFSGTASALVEGELRIVDGEPTLEAKLELKN